MVSPITPTLREYLIKTYIGFEIYQNQKHKEIKRQLMKDALIRYKKELINNKFGGSNYRYNLHWVLKKGYKNYKEYQNDLAKARGFKSHYEWEKFKREQKGITEKEYRENIAKKHGCKSYGEYAKVKRDAKLLTANRKIEHFKYRIEILERVIKSLQEENKILKNGK